MMATLKSRPGGPATVESKLMDGHYDRLLVDFEKKIEEAAAMLRRAHAAMKAENTLRS